MTVAIIAILTAVAVPAMTGIINNSRLKGQSEEVQATLQLARSEAVRSNKRVTACASASGTTCAASAARWVVFESVSKTILREAQMPSSLQVSGPASGLNFRASGMVDAETAFTVCMPTTQPANNQRVLTVKISGAVLTQSQNGGGACP